MEWSVGTKGGNSPPFSFGFSLEILAVLSVLPYTAAEMFAVVNIAGFQERVAEGDLLEVPLLDAKEGATVTFDDVLLLAKSDDDVTVGTPLVSGASVQAKVIGHGQGDKIRVFKMKRRKRYRRVHGHRQDYTEIEITKIQASGAAKVAPKKEEKKEEAKA